MVPYKQTPPDPLLRGWKQIAGLLGQSLATAQHWAKQTIPVRRRGRYVAASAEELGAWLARQQRGPVHIAARGERAL